MILQSWPGHFNANEKSATKFSRFITFMRTLTDYEMFYTKSGTLKHRRRWAQTILSGPHLSEKCFCRECSGGCTQQWRPADEARWAWTHCHAKQTSNAKTLGLACECPHSGCWRYWAYHDPWSLYNLKEFVCTN